MDDAKARATTGKAFAEWFAILDERGARDIPHKQIARLLQDDYDVPGWWSQSVTVEYEKHIGRRETGQTQRGDYEGTATRTLSGTMDEALDRWSARLAGEAGDGFDGVAFAGEASISRTEKWRYWRVSLADGTRVTVTISDKPGGAAKAGRPAALLAVTSSKLASKADGERWKTFWKAYLRAFSPMPFPARLRPILSARDSGDEGHRAGRQ